MARIFLHPSVKLGGIQSDIVANEEIIRHHLGDDDDFPLGNEPDLFEVWFDHDPVPVTLPLRVTR